MTAAHRLVVLLVLLVLALLSLGLGVSLGATPLPWSEGLRALLGQDSNPIVSELRLPRVLAALLVGAILGIAGAAFQGLFRNPLADPYLMGSAAGAALGVTLAASFTGGLATGYSSSQVFDQLPRLAEAWAFLGATGAVLLSLLLAGGASRPARLLLAGVVVGSVLGGLTQYLMLHDANRVWAVLSYTLGNLAFVGWDGIKRLLPFVILGFPLLLVLAPSLNALGLGEESARSLGIPLRRLQLALIVLVSLLVGVAVAQVGIIGFVGLVAPHLLRQLIGGDYRWLLPASALGGAVLLSFSDLLARIVSQPTELPVGVITTLLGGPFFLFLLWRQKLES